MGRSVAAVPRRSLTSADLYQIFTKGGVREEPDIDSLGRSDLVLSVWRENLHSIVDMDTIGRVT